MHRGTRRRARAKAAALPEAQPISAHPKLDAGHAGAQLPSAMLMQFREAAATWQAAVMCPLHMKAGIRALPDAVEQLIVW